MRRKTQGRRLILPKISLILSIFMLLGLIPAQATSTPSESPEEAIVKEEADPEAVVAPEAAAVFPAPAKSPFADVTVSQQFYAEMSWLAGTGISTGWIESDGTKTYRPLQPVNRDAMAAFMYRLSGSPEFVPPAQSPFADISTSQLFYKEMAWLADQGISTGWTEANGTRTYRALQSVNRDAMAAFMYRLSESPDFVPPKTSPFTDVKTSQLFYKEMAWLADQGISTGWTEANGTRTYRALQSVNRDAMAAFMFRFHQSISPLTITSTQLMDGFAGLKYLDQLNGTGGFGTLTWAATGLPKGMAISSDGTLTGFPAAIGNYKVAVTATDTAGMTASRTLALAVPDGTPQECAGQPCEMLVPLPGTVHVPGNSLVAVNRDPFSNEVTSIELTSTDVAVGQVMTLDPWENLESGAILRADEIQITADGTFLITVTVENLSAAYSEGTVHFVDPQAGTLSDQDQATPAEPLAKPAPSTIQCEGGATADLKGLAVTPSMDPSMYVDWNLSGLKDFQATLDGSITANLGVAVSGEGTCIVEGPEVKVRVPSQVGTIVMTAQPILTLEVNGALDISTSVTFGCGVNYQWHGGKEERTAFCKEEYEPLGLSTESGVEATLTGAIDTKVTWVELAGITGELSAAVTASYHPTDDPMAELAARVGFELGACVLCFIDSGPELSIYSGTIFEKTIATWASKPPAPGEQPPVVVPQPDPLKILTTSLTSGTAGKAYKTAFAALGGTKPYTWTISNGSLPAGLALDPKTGVVSGVPTKAAKNTLTATVADGLKVTASRQITLEIKPAPPRGNKVLVWGLEDEGYGVSNIADTLRGSGAEVVESTTLPPDLTPFKSIWNAATYSGWSAADERRVAEFIAGGGSAYLTGERPCCEDLNRSVERVLQQILTDQNVVVGLQGDVYGPYTFNPAARHDISNVPNKLGTFDPDAPGGITGIGGIDSRNVFVRSEDTAVGGVWGEDDMKSGRGRLVVLMDINYLEYEARKPILQNIHHFLSSAK